MGLGTSNPLVAGTADLFQGANSGSDLVGIVLFLTFTWFLQYGHVAKYGRSAAIGPCISAFSTL